MQQQQMPLSCLLPPPSSLPSALTCSVKNTSDEKGGWGIYPIISHRSLRKYSALKTLAYSALFGTIFLLFIGMHGLSNISWLSIPTASYGSLLFSIGPVTIFGLVAWNYGFSKVGSNQVMMYMYAIPVVAMATAALILDERMHAMQLLGAVIIFLGIYLVRTDKNVKKEQR